MATSLTQIMTDGDILQEKYQILNLSSHFAR
jgi:hypothetical protein